MSQASMSRCEWCVGSELYESYHDLEWGVPCHDSKELFEMINLEGAQAGLSWITILKKREGYRKLFSGFDPDKIARFNDAKLDKISSDPAIVRHRQKVEAVRTNARSLLIMRSNGEEFADFIWSYVNHRAIQNRFKRLSDVPSSTDVSALMSRDLKKRGFKFVGPTTCYAFMQAAGLVNDHMVSCPRYREIRQTQFTPA
ncbi:MAG: DNA-3-methyladenine glycosylase I [Granulosicoccus sp.]|nr:DNA-3-methyladenine glycosylase I [Granulosicoccus sp.]